MLLVLFDIDGTLIDSRKLIVEAKRRAFTALGLAPPDKALALSVVGLSPEQAFAELVGAVGPVAELAEAYRHSWHALRADAAFADVLFDGAADAVATLAAMDGLRLGIATGQSRRGVDHLLQRQGWNDLFTTIQTEDDAPSKPAPDMVLQALAATGVAAADCVMIGDTSFDMRMAKAAGVQAMGVSWGYHGVPALAEAGADIIVDSFAALVGRIARARQST